MIIQIPIISQLILLSSALIFPLLKKNKVIKVQVIGLISLLTVFALSIILLVEVTTNGAFYYQFGNYSASIGIEYLIDEFSALMGVFISGLSLLIFVYSLGDLTHEISIKQIGGYYTLALLMIFSMLGLNYSNDLFNVYVFMELLTLTIAGIIAIKQKKENYMSAFRYVLLNEIGSISFLFGIALLYMVTGHLNMTNLFNTIQQVYAIFPANINLALAFMLTGLAIKGALFPLHIWLPDAHSTAPTPSSAWLSGVGVKIYVVAMIKIIYRVIGTPILQSTNIPEVLQIISLTGMIFGSIFAIAQTDVKRMLAYSSVAQLGYIFLGIGLISSLGLRAALFQIFSHGIIKVALFLAAGVFIYLENKRIIKTFAGIGQTMPLSLTAFSLGAVAMVGIPLTSGFISKLYLGVAVMENNQYILLAGILFSSLLNLIYYLPIVTTGFLSIPKTGYVKPKLEKIPLSMLLPLIVLGLLIVGIGIFPNPLTQLIDGAVAAIIN